MTSEEYKKFREIWDLRARTRIKQIIEEIRKQEQRETEKNYTELLKKEQNENGSK